MVLLLLPLSSAIDYGEFDHGGGGEGGGGPLAAAAVAVAVVDDDWRRKRPATRCYEIRVLWYLLMVLTHQSHVTTL